ncbi:conserved hypothetical protein [Coccidioides posadasii str. Silveira]|uniref:Protein kinase domain-containing protein n=2 Tax=Coccidioides posadasii (strain RMSCC 757 / Silveira) TaxID=443226 RepID=E9D4J8_COCPS|nr:conserved hypothetical protein [Coccidioides posadasii str. Silveira]
MSYCGLDVQEVDLPTKQIIVTFNIEPQFSCVFKPNRLSFYQWNPRFGPFKTLQVCLELPEEFPASFPNINPMRLSNGRIHVPMTNVTTKSKGAYARIVHVIAILPERGIVMERLKEPLCLRLKTLQENGDTVSSEQIQRWSLQIAEGLHYIHSRVLQADIGSQNLLLDEKDNLKFADFAGSSIDGEQAFVCSSSRASIHPYW